MSEYQFYEFSCIDNRLTAKERKEIAAWSSRIGLTTTGAIFTYNYSDFPIDPVEATARYFDAMFYINNRKTRWLLLKFPEDLVDRKVIESYCSVEEISVLEYDKYLILDIGFCDDESDGWVDGEGVLASIIDLRQDILNGDYRCLYIAWLQACVNARKWNELDQNISEPVFSAALKPFNSTLESWIELLEVDRDILSVFPDSENSALNSASDILANNLDLLSGDEKVDFLKRLLQDEPLLSVKLRKHLTGILQTGEQAVVSVPARSIQEIFNEADRIKAQRKKVEQQKAEQKRLEKLSRTGLEEDMLWQRVHTHIAQKKSKSYDSAVNILKELLLFAEHQGLEAEYRQNIQKILNTYPRLSSLKAKIIFAGLA